MSATEPQEQVSIPEAIRRGLQYHQAGHLDAAAQVYEAVLTAEPEEPEALHLLGVVRDQQGRTEEGIALIHRSLAQRPDHAEAQNNYGLACQATGRMEEAKAAFDRALSLAPHYAEAHFNRAGLARGQGDAATAERHYREAVASAPQFAEAWFNLGNLLKDQDRAAEAVESYREAVRLRPGFAEAQNNLGIALHMTGALEEAITCYRQAITLNQGFAQGWSNLARALRELGHQEEAVRAYRQAYALLNPNDAQARTALADGLAEEGKLDLALVEYQRALWLQDPENPQAQWDLANALAALPAHREEAVTLYRTVIAARPDHAEAYHNLGSALNALGRWDESVEAYDHALRLRPGLFESHLNRGNALMKLMRWPEAEESYREAVRLDPDNALAARAFGSVLQRAGRWKEAIAEYERAISLKPDYADAWQNIGMVRQGLGLLEEAIACYRRALEIQPDYDGCHSSLLFALHNDHRVSAEDLAKETFEWAARVRKHCPHLSTPTNDRDPNRKLKIGYVSSDLRNHPVGTFLESVIACHDRAAFEVYGYAHQVLFDDQSERLMRHMDHWRAVYPLDDEQLARQIRADGIDILIDLNGHTANNRLRTFARKPAPVQMSWMGYFNTTGLPEMDYIVADRYVIPEGDERLYSETPLRLPDSYLCFTLPKHLDVAVVPPPVMSSGQITFGCFNYATKLVPPVIALWARILKETPGSTLFLKTQAFEEPSVTERFRTLFEREGIDPARIVTEGPSPRAQLLQAYGRMDISLDPFPYNGGTTTVESLWMGVPVVALRGDRFVSNVSNSILHAVGRGDWVCADEDAYVAKAVELASDPVKLADIRRALRPQMEASPICDAPRFARNLEAGCREAWKTWCQAKHA